MPSCGGGSLVLPLQAHVLGRAVVIDFDFDHLQPLEEQQQSRVERLEPRNQGFGPFFGPIAGPQLQQYGCLPSQRLLGGGQTRPVRSDHAEAFVGELEGIVAGIDPNQAGNGKDGLEADALLADALPIIHVAGRFRAQGDAADGLHIGRREAPFVAVEAKPAGVPVPALDQRHRQRRRHRLVVLGIVGVLQQLEQEVSRVAVVIICGPTDIKTLVGRA